MTPDRTGPTRADRLRRELRNPSLLTVFVIIVLVLAIPAAIVLPHVIDTATTNIAAHNEQLRQREESLLPEEVILPAQVTPWFFSRIRIMQEADTPDEWFATSFTEGPCNTNNLAQFPTGKYTAAVFRACSDLNRIQEKFGPLCTEESCDLPPEAALELDGAALRLVDAFSDANFVLPYESSR